MSPRNRLRSLARRASRLAADCAKATAEMTDALAAGDCGDARVDLLAVAANLRRGAAEYVGGRELTTGNDAIRDGMTRG